MSLRAIIWAFDQIAAGRSPSTSASLVLLKIADRANDDGVCWPGRQRLGRDVALSDETVRQCVRKLEPAGLVIVERRQDAVGRDLSNIYRLPLWEGQDFTTPQVKYGGGGLQTGPEAIKRTIFTSSNKREGLPLSGGGGGVKEKKRKTQPAGKKYQLTDDGVTYQPGNRDDELALTAIQAFPGDRVRQAVLQAGEWDDRGRAWPSAVLRILKRGGGGQAAPPAWATISEDDPPSRGSGRGCYETDFEIIKE